MEVSLTLLVQTIVSAEDEESYEEQREEIVRILEEKGFAVSIENEKSDDFDDEFYVDGFDDDDDEDEEEEW